MQTQAATTDELVREVADWLAGLREVTEEVVTTAEERMIFKLPAQLAS